MISSSKLISDKDGVSLLMTNEGDIVKFKVNFNIYNPLIDVKTIIGFKLFELMGAINKDIIDEVKIIKHDDSHCNTLMVLKKIGEELGLSQKYIFSDVKLSWNKEHTIAQFVSTQEVIPTNVVIPSGSESVTTSDSVFIIKVSLDTHTALVTYAFSLVIDSSMPKYMRRMPGNIMHTVFLRVKKFIENLGTDSKE
jgi:hypothetical protein